MPRPLTFLEASKKFSSKFPEKRLLSYQKSSAPVSIRCPAHGDVWFSTLSAALRSVSGCPECSLEVRSEFLANNSCYNQTVFLFDPSDQSYSEFPSIKSAGLFLGVSAGAVSYHLNKSDTLLKGYLVLGCKPDLPPTLIVPQPPDGSIPVSDYPDYYIHPNGTVYSMKTASFIQPVWNKSSNSLLVRLSNDEGAKQFTFARLMLQTFRTDEPLPKRITYKDGDRRNCSLDNLA